MTQQIDDSLVQVSYRSLTVLMCDCDNFPMWANDRCKMGFVTQEEIVHETFHNERMGGNCPDLPHVHVIIRAVRWSLVRG